VEIYNNYNWKTEVLAASIRHPSHVIETARAGADVATMPFKVRQQLIKHPLTDKGLDQFLADWRKSVSSTHGMEVDIGNSNMRLVSRGSK
jgi:transaldolase